MASNIGYQCVFRENDTFCNKIYMQRGRLINHLKLCHPSSIENEHEYIKTIDITDKPKSSKKRKQNIQTTVTMSPKQKNTETISIEPTKKISKTDVSEENSVEIIGCGHTKLINGLKNNIEIMASQLKTLENRLNIVEKKDKKLCIACWEYESTFALQPCGHKLLCGTCAATMLHSHPQCPFCRTKVTDIIQIWDVAMNENENDIALI